MYALLHHGSSEHHVGMGHRGRYEIHVVEVEAAIADFVAMCGSAMAVPSLVSRSM